MMTSTPVTICITLRRSGERVLCSRRRKNHMASSVDHVESWTRLISIRQTSPANETLRQRRHLQGAAKKWTPKVFRRFLNNRLGF